MRRIAIIIVVLVLSGLGGAFYFDVFTSREVKRDRHLKKGRDYVAQAKINEAVIEFTKAAKIDPAFAETRYELGLVLLRRNDLRAAYQEFVRASDLKPDW